MENYSLFEDVFNQTYLGGEHMREHEVPGLGKVKVKKEKLLARLKENMLQHEQEYKKAHTAWHKEYTNLLEQAVLLAREGESFTETLEKGNDLPVPRSYLDEYKEVVEMLEFSEGNEVVLSRREFGQYVMDKWSWTESFKMSTSNYSR